MTITTLAAHKGNTWKLELDDSGELYFLHVSVVQRCGLQKGMTLTPQQWEQVQTTELARKAYQYACFLLDRRGYSYQEMFRKLEPKYPQSVCYATVDRLAKFGQINDRAYAEQLAHHYVEVKHFGLRRARQEMYRRGLLDEHITEALEPYEDEVTGGILEELVAGNDRRTIEKGKAALARQGYRFSEINAAVQAFLEEMENVE